MLSFRRIKISEIDFDYYYNLVSCVDVNDRFLNMSIKDNLNIVSGTFEEIIYICKRLKIHDEIANLKYGYDTILNSKDDTLAPNTKVLLNIARILLKNTKIMMFDKILSSLDGSSRKVVLEILNRIKQDHTIIIIDKNDEVLKFSDNVILLNESEVSKIGEYKTVSKTKIYKKIISN